MRERGVLEAQVAQDSSHLTRSVSGPYGGKFFHNPQKTPVGSTLRAAGKPMILVGTYARELTAACRVTAWLST